MTDDYDDNVVYGDEIGYVPCFQAASAVPTLVADDNAVYGEESGYVPLDTAAAADPASEQDELAVYGDNVGFVAKPCEECIDFDFSAACRGFSRTSATRPWSASSTATSATRSSLGRWRLRLHEHDRRRQPCRELRPRRSADPDREALGTPLSRLCQP
jgi:hypothetical protein